eukprot:384742_1
MMDQIQHVGNEQKNSRPLVVKTFYWFRQWWVKYKFWNQNFVIIISSSITVGALLYQWIPLQTACGNLNYDEDGNIIYTKNCDWKRWDKWVDISHELSFIGVTCGCITFASISSMIFHKWQCCVCLTFFQADNKFRVLCFSKTLLLLIKQQLISQTTNNIWKRLLQILSVVSLLTIAIITWSFDYGFIRKLNNIKHWKCIYITYG